MHVTRAKKFCYIARRDVADDGQNDAPENLFDSQFRTIEVHQSSDVGFTSFYPAHKDKVGNLVTFFLVAGGSFNFVAYPTDPSSRKTVKLTKYGIEKTEGAHAGKDDWSSWKEYGNYRKELSNLDLNRVENFEKKLQCKQHRIHVYKMTPGNRLVFPAKYYAHGSIIPRQKLERTMVVFYRLVPIENNANPKKRAT